MARCQPQYYGDGWCDTTNNNKKCGYDGGDCCVESCIDGLEYPCGTNLKTGTDGYNCKEPSCETVNLELIGDVLNYYTDNLMSDSMCNGYCDTDIECNYAMYGGTECQIFNSYSDKVYNSLYSVTSGNGCIQSETPSPTNAPTTLAPTDAPTNAPTTLAPTDAPTNAPTTLSPTDSPTNAPTTLVHTTSSHMNDFWDKLKPNSTDREYLWYVYASIIGLLILIILLYIFKKCTSNNREEQNNSELNIPEFNDPENPFDE